MKLIGGVFSGVIAAFMIIGIAVSLAHGSETGAIGCFVLSLLYGIIFYFSLNSYD